MDIINKAEYFVSRYCLSAAHAQSQHPLEIMIEGTLKTKHPISLQFEPREQLTAVAQCM